MMNVEEIAPIAEMKEESIEDSDEITSYSEFETCAEGPNVDFRTNFMHTYVCKSPEETALLEKLRQFSCHFTWDLSIAQEHSTKTIGTLIQGLKDKVDEESRYGKDKLDYLNSFFHVIQLGYYAAGLKQYDAAMSFFMMALEKANHVSLNTIKPGLVHIAEGNRAFIAFLSGNYELCNAILSAAAVDWLNVEAPSRAALTGNYAVALMELGIGGSHKALPLLRDVVHQDPKMHEWHLRLGMALMRIRHTQGRYMSPSAEESSEFETAFVCAPSNSSRVAVYLAQSLKEKTIRNERERQDNENRSKALFDLALKRNPDSSDINIRCADGYMNLRLNNRDLRLAEECIIRAVSIAKTNAMVCHKAATFYERFKKDYDTALKYLDGLTQRGVHIIAADFRRVDLKLLVDPNFNAIDELTRMKEHYNPQRNVVIGILSFRGLINFMKFGNILSAYNDWMEAMLLGKQMFRNEFLRHLRSLLVFKDMKQGQTKVKIEELKQRIQMSRNTETDQQKLHFFGEMQAIADTFIAMCNRSVSPYPEQTNKYNQGSQLQNNRHQPQPWRPLFQQSNNYQSTRQQPPFSGNHFQRPPPQSSWNHNSNFHRGGHGGHQHQPQSYRFRFYGSGNNSFNNQR